MSGYFRRLAARAQGRGEVLTPRPVSRFEAGPEEPEGIATAESWTEPEATPAATAHRGLAAAIPPLPAAPRPWRLDDAVAPAMPLESAMAPPPAAAPLSAPAPAMALRRAAAEAVPVPEQRDGTAPAAAAPPMSPVGAPPMARTAMPATSLPGPGPRAPSTAAGTVAAPAMAPPAMMVPAVTAASAPPRAGRDAAPGLLPAVQRAASPAALPAAAATIPVSATAWAPATRNAPPDVPPGMLRSIDLRTPAGVATPAAAAPEISIGRVEVRFTPPPAAPAARAGGPPPLEALLTRARR